MKNEIELQLEIARLKGIIEGKEEIIDFLKDIIKQSSILTQHGESTITVQPWATIPWAGFSTSTFPMSSGTVTTSYGELFKHPTAIETTNLLDNDHL